MEPKSLSQSEVHGSCSCDENPKFWWSCKDEVSLSL